MEHHAWLAQRREGITGSDIAAICGQHAYKDPFSVYCEKLGLYQQEETLPMRRGQAMEAFVAAEYARQNGCTLEQPDPMLVVHPTIPWALGSPDRYVVETGIGLELKDVGLYQAQRWGESMTGDLAAEALLQSHWYLGITQRPAWDVAAILTGSEYRQYHIEPDPELFGQLVQIAEKFRTDHILKECPPEMVGSERTLGIIKQLYPSQHDDEMLLAEEQQEAWMTEYIEANQELKTLEKRINLVKAQLTAAIGSHAGIATQGLVATWKESTPSKIVDWKALALAQNPSLIEIEAYTHTKPGSRRFLCRTVKEK